MSLKRNIYIKCPFIYYTLFKSFTYFRTLPYRRNPRKYIEKIYRKKFNVSPDFINPLMFYDKLNFLNLFFYPKMDLQKFVDKEESKEMIRNNFGTKHVADTISVFSDFKSFKKFYTSDNFPKSCVIKLTHTSGVVFFYSNGQIRDKFGQIVSCHLMLSCLRIMLPYRHYYFNFESPYKGLKGKILVEEYLDFKEKEGLNEYKFFCNYGETKMINVVYGRQIENEGKTLELFTDADLKPIPASQKLPLIDADLLFHPSCLNEMKQLCRQMTSQFPIVRVDFLVFNDNYYFCEFTFVDCGGLSIFKPIESNALIGNLFDISEIVK